MQRLLRGRLLYLLLGLFLVLLYWWSARHGLLHPFEAALAAPPSEQLHAQLDLAALAQRMHHEPGLAFALSVLTLFIAGMALGGLALMLRGFWTGRAGSVWRFAARRLPHWSFGELIRITLLMVMVAALMPFIRITLLAAQPAWMLDAHLWLTVSMLALDLFLVLAVWTFAQGKRWRRPVWEVLGFAPRRVARAVEMGFRGYLIVFPWLFLLLFLIIQVAEALHLEPPIEPIHELIFAEQRLGVLGLTFVLACLVGPVAEEIFFRGVVYSALRQRIPRGVAMVISAALFALIHTSPIGFLPIALLGCLLAYLYERSGSLVGPMAIHVLHNTFLMLLAMVVRRLMVPG